MTNNQNFHLYLLLTLNMILWGGGWIANKLIVYEANIIVLTFWRFFITFLSLLPLLYFVKKPIVVTKKSLYITFKGAILSMAFMIMAFLGVKQGFAGRAGVIITTLSPIITFFLASLLFSFRLSRSQIFGLFLGFIGGLMLFEVWEFNFAQILNDGSLYFIACAIIWSFVTIESQRASEYLEPFVYTIILTGIASFILFVFSLSLGIGVVFDKGIDFWFALLYISILAQSVANTIYYYTSPKLGSATTSSFLFIVPVTAIFFAWLILDEIPSIYLLIGGGVNLLALYIINKQKAKN